MGLGSGGTLMLVGGSEDKRAQRTILRAIADAAGTDGNEPRIVVVTTATALPHAAADTYRALFTELGVAQVDHLDLRTRDEAYGAPALDLLYGAPVVFFTGGNQLRLTAHLGGTPVMDRVREIYDQGGTIAGTSAGAVALGEHMPYEQGEPAHGMRTSAATSAFHMLPGLGLLPAAIVDSHFSQRGRMWRLRAALPRFPGALALGIDEDTALLITGGIRYSVLGRGHVYVLDAAPKPARDDMRATHEGEMAATHQPATHQPHRIEIKTAVLGTGDTFVLRERQSITGQSKGCT